MKSQVNSLQNTLSKRDLILQGLLFSGPALAVSFISGPLGIIQGIYSKHYGMALTWLAAVLLVTRIVDGIADPVIGYFSDRYKTKTGTRKPFVLIGCLLLTLSCYFLFIPSGDVNILYFAFWSVFFYIAFTIHSIPYYAWASEIDTNSERRTMVFSVMSIMTQMGVLLFYLVPFLPIFSSSEITPETLKVSTFLGIGVMFISLYLCLKFAPDGTTALKGNSRVAKQSANMFLECYQIIKINYPFRIFVCAYIFMGLGMGMWSGLFFIYIDAFLGLGELFAQVALIGIVLSIVIMPIGYKIVLALGNKNAWLMSAFIVLCGIIYTGFLNPGNAGFEDLIILKIIFAFGGAASGIILPSILSTIIDYGFLKEGLHRNALYFAAFTLLTKIQIAAGIALGLAIAGWFGFDVTATEHSKESAFGIHLAMAWVPGFTVLVAILFICFFPLNQHRCSVIRRRLDLRIQRRQSMGKKSEISDPSVVQPQGI